MAIIDTHAHLDQLEDINGALTRAHQAGVTDIIAVSVDLPSMRKVLDLGLRTQGIRIHPALGLHPGMIKPEEQQEAFDFITTHIHQAVAVGETGLDYWYKWVRKDESERRKQKDSFAFHLDMAKKFDLPIVIHSRGAWRDCLDMAKEAMVSRVLFHWYSGPVDILDQILSEGYYVSTSPSVAYSPQSITAMSHAPLERILIETDSPVRYHQGEEVYLAEPKDVIRTLNALALLKDMNSKVVLDAVNKNARYFFRI